MNSVPLNSQRNVWEVTVMIEMTDIRFVFLCWELKLHSCDHYEISLCPRHSVKCEKSKNSDSLSSLFSSDTFSLQHLQLSFHTQFHKSRPIFRSCCEHWCLKMDLKGDIIHRMPVFKKIYWIVWVTVFTEIGAT